MSNANQPGAAWAGPGDPFVLVAGHLVSPKDGFGEIGRMANGDLRRPSRMEVGTGGIHGQVTSVITRFGAAPTLDLRRANGTEAVPTAVLNGEELGAYQVLGHDGIAFADAVQVRGVAAENWAAGAHGAHLELATVPVGAAALVPRWIVLAAGHLIAAADNIVDIGETGAGRPRSIFIGTGGIHGQVIGAITRFGAAPTLDLRRANGTEAVPTAVLNGETLADFNFIGHDGTAFGDAPRVRAVAAENWAAGAHGAELDLFSVPIGSAVVTNRWQIQAAGHFVAASDGVVDIGVSGANRPRNGFFTGVVRTGSNDGFQQVDNGGTARKVLVGDAGDVLNLGDVAGWVRVDVFPGLANPAFRVDQSAVARDTRMMVWDVDNGQIERVSVGAADTGGAGFKVLRIPN